MDTKNTRPPKNPETNNAPGRQTPGATDEATRFLKPETVGGRRNPFEDSRNNFAIGRIINTQGAAEGTILPPRQGGELRVPLVTGLKVVKTARYFGQTQVTLTWDQPEIVPTQLSHFNIYVTGLLPGSNQPQGPTSVSKSPGQVLLTTRVPVIAVFTVQTVLKSGLMSLITTSPSVSAPIAGGNFTPSDYTPGTIPVDALEDNAPGSLISWDTTGVVGLVGAGSTNQILTGNGAAFPVFKSRTTLDLVQGRSNLTTAGRIVLVDSAGVVTQAAGGFGDIVLGGANLTTPGAVPFGDVISATITDDPTEFFWDDTNNRLGIGTNAPASKIHILQPTLGNEVQRLETTATNDDVSEKVYQNKVTTTNATLTTLHTVAIASSITLAIDAVVVARRTGGASGTAEDGARYHLQAVYKNVAGVATIIGAINTVTDEDQVAWDATFNVSSGNVLIQVTGAAANNISWVVTAKTYSIGT